MKLSDIENTLFKLKSAGIIRANTDILSTKNGFYFIVDEDSFDNVLYDLEEVYSFDVYEPRFEGDGYVVKFSL